MSECERFAQIAQDNVSESLRSLKTNELMSESLVFLSESLIRSFFRIKRAIQIPSPVKNKVFHGFCWIRIQIDFLYGYRS